MQTNLPVPNKQDSAIATKLYFNNYGTQPVELLANEVSATVGFFESKGFDSDAALTTASVILDQAKADGVAVFEILDTLKTFDATSLSGLVSEILNNNRPSSSSLGYKTPNVSASAELRNILP
jgi:hypothetical protein